MIPDDIEKLLDELGVVEPPKPPAHAPVAQPRQPDKFRPYNGEF